MELSLALLPVDGFQVGQHPLVARLLKRDFNRRPPETRYAETWEVSLLHTSQPKNLKTLDIPEEKGSTSPAALLVDYPLLLPRMEGI